MHPHVSIAGAVSIIVQLIQSKKLASSTKIIVPIASKGFHALIKKFIGIRDQSRLWGGERLSQFYCYTLSNIVPVGTIKVLNYLQKI